MNVEEGFHMLLGQSSRLESLASGVRYKSSTFDSSDVLLGFGIVAGVILGISFLYMLMNRSERTRRFNSPKELFRSLCRVHQLDRANRRVLKAMARHQRLTQPARLFLEPERFESVNLSPALRTQLGVVEALQAKLFEKPAPTPA